MKLDLGILRGVERERDLLQVAHEHMLPSCVRNLLGGLLSLAAAPTAAGTLLLAILSDEPHEFGILAAALLAVGYVFQAICLGPNPPARDILFVAARSPLERSVLVRLALRLDDLSEFERHLARFSGTG